MVVSKYIRMGLLASSFLLGTSAFAGNMAGAYSVELNKTEIVRFSQPAAAVIIGNPKIADVSVHSSDTVFVLGRGYGQTNLLVLNSAGETIMDADIQVVSANSAGSVRLYSGKERSTYSCAPYCLPSPILGDSAEFMATNSPDTPEIATSTIAGTSSMPQNMVGVSMASDPTFIPDSQEVYYPE
ncbi:MAG: hypothetical protein HKN36_13480 [Hellea sp.]|nr:hypothetical protein [Hellea sp.]